MGDWTVGLPSVPGEGGLRTESRLEMDKISPSGEFGFDVLLVVLIIPSSGGGEVMPTRGTFAVPLVDTVYCTPFVIGGTEGGGEKPSDVVAEVERGEKSV